MNELLLATALFLLIHFGISPTPLRGLLMRKLGEGPYMGLYSLGALAALVWMGFAFAAAPREPLWTVGPFLHAVPLVVLPFTLLGLVAGNSVPNPAALSKPGAAGALAPARGILRVTRHPVNMSIALWAGAHIVATGDGAALVLFGGLLLLAVVGPLLIERRRHAALGEPWEAYAATTSLVPFAAILAGRNKLVLGEIGWRRLAIALALYALVLWVHPWLFGVQAY